MSGRSTSESEKSERRGFSILLTASPYTSQDAVTVLQLAQAALRQGHPVRLFLMDDGVYLAAKRLGKVQGTDLRSQLEAVLKAGGEVAICDHNAMERGLYPEALVEGVIPGSQYDHAQSVAKSARVLSFTGGSI